MDTQEYLREEAEYLAREIACNSRIKKFVRNPDVIGAYAEATVRQLVSEIVAPVRVCTGAVIGAKLCSNPADVPQLV